MVVNNHVDMPSEQYLGQLQKCIINLGNQCMLCVYGNQGMLCVYGNQGVLCVYGNQGVLCVYGNQGVLCVYGNQGVGALRTVGSTLPCPGCHD